MVIVIVIVSWGRWPGGDRRECQLVACWLWVAGCGLRGAGCRLGAVGCELGALAGRRPARVSACDLLVVGCRLWPAVRGSGARL